MIKLSLVVPCYNEETNIFDFYDAAKNVFGNASYNYEIVFINDGSKDDTQKRLSELYKKVPDKITVINFSRNFGKEAAILAGLRRSRGDYICIIDADLQQHPQVAHTMVDFLLEHEEYDSVAAYQKTRDEAKIMITFKTLFYKIINRISDTTFVNGASDFRVFSRTMVNAILQLNEYHRFSKGIFSWVGFETYFMPYEAQKRNSGETKWSFKKLFKYAVEGFMSFTTFPLRISTFLGLISSLLSIIYLFVVIIQKLVFSINIPGYPTIISLILLIGGIQLLMLGIIGEYLARVYMQGKERPIYIEKEVLNSIQED